MTHSKKGPLSCILALGMIIGMNHGATGAVYLSDMTEISAIVGWGTMHWDKSIEGNTLSINGITYGKGLGVHANSTVIYPLNGNFTRFTAVVGIDDETNGNGSIDFQVYLDDMLAWDSGVLGGKSPRQVMVNVTGASRLRLVVTDGGDGNGWDHADWADARLEPVDPNFSLSKIKVLCVGNSITEGWGLPDPASQSYPSLLQSLLGSRYQVINSGLGGRTLLKNGDVPYWKESRFRDIFTTRPDIITIMLGTNDSKPWNWDEHGAEYATDLAAMVDTLSGIANAHSTYSQHPRIFLCLPPPATESNGPSIRGSIIANEIIPDIRAVAQSRGCTLIDVHSPFLDRTNLLPDGVHPGVEGAKLLGDLFHESLSNLALDRSPATRLLWYGSAPGATADNDADRPMLFAYPAPDSARNGAAVIICPGGGYANLAMDHEGHAVAKWFNQFGVTAFVLRYRYNPYRHPIELNDAKRAMRIVRYNAAVYGLDTTRIGLMGFSAGGHLASTLGTHFDAGISDSRDPIEQLTSRPDFMALIYPVITLSGQYAHTGSRDNLLGTSPGAELIDSLCNQKWVTPQTPPTFLASGDADDVVPIQNSHMFDSALVANGVAQELFVDPGKGHGYGLAGDWPEALIAWMKKRNIIPAPVEQKRYSKLEASKAFLEVTAQPNRVIRIFLNASAAPRIEIYSISGRRLASFGNAPDRNYLWHAPAQGVYVIHAVMGGKTFSGKVVCR